MTTFVINLSKNYTSLSIGEPFLYELLSNQQLYITNSTEGNLVQKVDSTFLEIKRQLRVAKSYDWNAIVLVDLQQEQEATPYIAGLLAKCKTIQERIIQPINESTLKGPNEITVVWLDNQNEEYIHFKQPFFRKCVDFDRNGFLQNDEGDYFIANQQLEEFDRIWRSAQIDTQRKNIDELPDSIIQKCGSTLNIIQQKVHAQLDTTDPSLFTLDETISILSADDIRTIKKQLDEELDLVRQNPKEWNSFLPSDLCKRVLKDTCSIFNHTILRKFIFLRLAYHNQAQDHVKLAFLFNLLVRHPEIVRRLKDDKQPYFTAININEERMKSLFGNYIDGLSQLEGNLNNSTKRTTKRTIEQFEEPDLIKANPNDIPNHQFRFFRFSPFYQAQTVPRFEQWFSGTERDLFDMYDRVPKIVEDTFQANEKQALNASQKEWSVQEIKEELTQLENKYTTEQKALNNAILNKNLFSKWSKIKEEKVPTAINEFRKRPLKTAAFFTAIIGFLILILPFVLGWHYFEHQDARLSVGVSLGIVLAIVFWTIHRIIKPIKKLLLEIRDIFYHTKKSVYQEIEHQERYIHSIMKSNVLRKNINILQKELGELERQKQLTQYQIKESKQHIGLVNNLANKLKINVPTGLLEDEVALEMKHIHQPFYKHKLANPHIYLKEKGKLNLQIDHSPAVLNIQSNYAQVIKEISFIEDRVEHN